MRISQVMLSKGFGGAERFFVDMSLALARRGHTVQAICESRFGHRQRLLGVDNIEVAPVRVLGPWDRWAADRVKRAIRDFAPQVIQGHLARAASFAGRAARDLELPLAVKTHNYVDLKYYRNVTRFIATTRDQREYLIAQGIAPEAAQVIPNFSALPVAPVREARPGSTIHLVSYGRLVRKKGFDLLLDALARMTHAGRDVRLTLGGDGPELARLKSQARALGIARRVNFTGWIDGVSDILLPATAFVLPSHDEPFGIVVLEAMAAGVPVVSTLTQGPREVLHKDWAYLCEVGDLDSLVTALSDMADDPAGRTECARRAQALYLERYCEAAVIPQYLRVYADLIQTTRGD